MTTVSLRNQRSPMTRAMWERRDSCCLGPLNGRIQKDAEVADGVAQLAMEESKVVV